MERQARDTLAMYFFVVVVVVVVVVRYSTVVVFAENFSSCFFLL